MRKITRKGLVRKLDTIVREIILVRDSACVCCHMIPFSQAGHLFSRVAYSTRWNLNNVFRQCAGCNLKHEYDPYPLTNYYLNKFGKEAYDNLHREWSTPHKYKDFQLQELYDDLAKQLQAMKEGDK